MSVQEPSICAVPNVLAKVQFECKKDPKNIPQMRNTCTSRYAYEEK